MFEIVKLSVMTTVVMSVAFLWIRSVRKQYFEYRYNHGYAKAFSIYLSLSGQIFSADEVAISIETLFPKVCLDEAVSEEVVLIKIRNNIDVL
jgi:hypothetical protein